VRFLFWNTNQRPVEPIVARLAQRHDVDLLVLAESALSPERLLGLLNPGQAQPYRCPPGLSRRLTFYVRESVTTFASVTDTTSAAIRRVGIGCDQELLIVAVHLPSKMYATDTEQLLGSTGVSQDIREAERRVGHMRTIVLGDLNMDPFEPGVVGSHGLHAVMDRHVASRGTRRVAGKDYPLFYNPTWSFLGDRGGRPAGTFFYRKSSPVCYFWHMFDQALVRPGLLDLVDDDSFGIITTDGETPLFASGSRPDATRGSDHFPILLRLGKQRQVKDDGLLAK